MERIRLSKTEKKVLLIVDKFNGKCPYTYPRHTFNSSVRSLERKGLVKGAYIEGGEVEAARLTNEGKQYLCENPRLSNPTDWGKIAAITGIIALIISIIALFVGCSILIRM